MMISDTSGLTDRKRANYWLFFVFCAIQRGRGVKAGRRA